jgi:hypothetical protein
MMLPVTDQLSREPGAALRLTALLVACALVAGCESDANKYERLHTELVLAESPLRYADWAATQGKPQCPELVSLPTNEYLTRCTEQLDRARTRAALAQRKLNGFMNH